MRLRYLQPSTHTFRSASLLDLALATLSTETQPRIFAYEIRKVNSKKYLCKIVVSARYIFFQTYYLQ